MSVGGITLANTAALWGLLALPALVAVHFFQQRSRRVLLGTRFLLEAIAPESRGGRTWERFRASRAFWLQCLAVLLLVWVLAAPRWPRADSTQTVVLVLDDALAMRAVTEEARLAVRELGAELAGRAARTEWVLMTSDARRPALYRGADRARMLAALDAWSPTLGTHDYDAALRLGRGLAAADGECWFITDREEKVPPDQAAIGVGRALANVGFAGGVVARAESEVGAESGAGAEAATKAAAANIPAGARVWRAVLRNHADEAQSRAWWIEGPGGASERRAVRLEAGGVIELSGVWPVGAERAVLRLEPDGFAEDDRLPLVAPRPKSLGARVTLAGARGEFFRKLLAGIPGVDAGASLGATLRVLETRDAETVPPGAAILLAAPETQAASGAATDAATAGDASASGRRALVRTPVVAERHALVDALNWRGLLGPGPSALRAGEADEVLLWQGERPLVWLRGGVGGAEARRQLVLNFDWEAGNAGRLPATVLLLRRFVEGLRDEQPGAYAANFDTGARVELAVADVAQAGGAGGAGDKEPAPVRWTLVREAGGGGRPAAADRRAGEDAGAPSDRNRGDAGAPSGVFGGSGETRELDAGELAVLRAPAEAGFFEVRRGADVLVSGAAQFADARQGDFRGAARFRREAPAGAAAARRERQTQGDPLGTLWLALAGAALLGSWWPGGAGRAPAPRAASPGGTGGSGGLGKGGLRV